MKTGGTEKVKVDFPSGSPIPQGEIQGQPAI